MKEGKPNSSALKPTKSSAAPVAANNAAEKLREFARQIEQQRNDLKTIYYIADQLSMSIRPNMLCRRVVELTDAVFGSNCVLIAGHFNQDTHAFSGTITYLEPRGDIVERPYPDENVKTAVSFYNVSIVEKWLRGELDGMIRIREAATVAYPLQRHGLRLGLILAPVLGRQETQEHRRTAMNPEIVQAARQHLAVALELSELQREQLQQERLAAIGQTVAGLAHHLKNILNGLKGGEYVFERALKTNNPEKLRKGITILNSSIQHIERLTYDMLYYAGDRALDLKSTNPNDVMQELCEFFEESAAVKGIAIKTQLDKHMIPILLDRHALYRALLNLVTNSIDACLESEKGNAVFLKSALKPDSILLTVEDNGVGIDPASLRRVTEKFYTTKSSKGTGLGLPVVIKIAEKHGGSLDIESVPGEGSAFHIRLPRNSH